MTQYALEYTDGRVNDIVADTDQEAIAAALARFEPEATAAEAWENAGSENGLQREGLLIWESEAEAANDDGFRAVAHLTVVRTRSAD